MPRSFGILLLLCTLIVFVNGRPPVHLSADGVDALTSKYQPYTVAIKYRNRYTCTGSIISPTKILTTASCVRNDFYGKLNNNNFTVYAGSPRLSSGGSIYHIQSIKVPDEYTFRKIGHDIAVVTLTTPIEYSDNQKPIGLPDKDVINNSFGVTSGWGLKLEDTTVTDNLQSFKKQIITAAKCNFKYFNEGPKIQVDIDEFCSVPHADNTGFCGGHSGSPMIQDEKVVGITAWGLADCSQGYPDIFTNVYKYLEFIEKEIQ